MAREKRINLQKLFDFDRQEVLKCLETNGAVKKSKLNHEELEVITTDPMGLSILESELRRGGNSEAIFFPTGIPSAQGGFILGQESFLSNVDVPGSVNSRRFNTAYGRMRPGTEITIAFPRGTRISGIVEESLGESVIATESKVSESIDKISNTIELYDPRMAGQIETNGLAETISAPGDYLEQVPLGIINPEDAGVGDFIDPLTYLTKILQEDRMPVQGVTERFGRAWNRLRSSSKINIGKKDYHQATLTMLHVLLGMHSYDERRSEGEKKFGIEDYVRSAFAALNLDIGLWILSDKAKGIGLVKNHPLRGAALYKLLAQKDGDFTGIVDPSYGEIILRHHAGLGTKSRYPLEYRVSDYEVSMSPEELGPLEGSTPLSVTNQLSFIYGTLYPRVRHWLISEDAQKQQEDLAKSQGWRSSEQKVIFETLNWFKSRTMEGYLTPEILDQESRAIGVYPEGSHVTIHQEGAENRVRSKHNLDGCGGEVLSDGRIEIQYDGAGKPLYGQKPVDLRRGLGEQFALKLKRI